MICAVAFLFCAAEATALYNFSPNEDKYSYLFSTPLLAFSWLFRIIQVRKGALPEVGSRLLRDMSLTIYCIHPLVIEIVNVCSVLAGIGKWLVVTILSVAISAVYAWLRIDIRKNRRFKR